MPDWPKEIRAAIAELALEPTREAEVVEEMSLHLRDRYDEMLSSGVDAEQAYRTLLQELNDGSLVRGLKATVRKADPPMATGKAGNERWFASLWSDLRYGARLLGKIQVSPWSRFSLLRWALARIRQFSSCSMPSACAHCR